MKITFICTGSCEEAYPIHEHCKECSHANFKATVPYNKGKVTIWFNMLHGPTFYLGREYPYPSKRSKLLKLATEIKDFGKRNCDYWYKRNLKKKGEK